MTEKPNRPREYDAVLGAKNPPPVNAAVLGGIESVKKRLAATDELVRATAVRDAMKYGEAGLNLAIASLKDKSPQVRRTVVKLLKKKLSHPKVQALAANNKLIEIYPQEFDTVKVNEFGEIIQRDRRLAEMFAEDLGDGVELEMVSIPGGSFLMGLPKTEDSYPGCDGREEPQHRVNVPPFFIGKHPVTQQQYEAVMGYNPSGFKGANRPVESVTWRDATDFCWLLSQKTEKNYRLPSEAQWEYACRAGTTTPFYFGETITTDLANYDGYGTYGCGPWGVSRQQTTDVCSFPPNGFGLYDMHGNVWEYCQDAWHKNYHGAPTDGSVWESDGDSFLPLLRGGSWLYDPEACRSAHRYEYVPANGDKHRGFRVALEPGL